jgi:hypothetical protein
MQEGDRRSYDSRALPHAIAWPSGGFTTGTIGGIIGHACPHPPPRSQSPAGCWRVYFGDVHAGTIMQCVGNPGAAPKWQWRSGFYPGSRPGECTNGSAATFEQARAAFEAAWRMFLSKRTEADFQAWREHQEWTAEKYRQFDQGERMSSGWRHRA